MSEESFQRILGNIRATTVQAEREHTELAARVTAEVERFREKRAHLIRADVLRQMENCKCEHAEPVIGAGREKLHVPRRPGRSGRVDASRYYMSSLKLNVDRPRELQAETRWSLKDGQKKKSHARSGWVYECLFSEEGPSGAAVFARLP